MHMCILIPNIVLKCSVCSVNTYWSYFLHIKREEFKFFTTNIYLLILASFLVFTAKHHSDLWVFRNSSCCLSHVVWLLHLHSLHILNSESVSSLLADPFSVFWFHPAWLSQQCVCIDAFPLRTLLCPWPVPPSLLWVSYISSYYWAQNPFLYPPLIYIFMFSQGSFFKTFFVY